MPTIALVRHGRTEWNARELIQGRTDIPLDGVGRGQAARAGIALAAFPAERVVTSPLQRAAETGRIIGERLGLPVVHDEDDLVEREYGPFEGQDVFESRAAHPDGAFPGAELEADVARRGADAIARILADGDAIVVAHGTLLRLALGELTGAPFPRFGNADIVLLSTTDDDGDGLGGGLGGGTAGAGVTVRVPVRAEWLVGPTAVVPD